MFTWTVILLAWLTPGVILFAWLYRISRAGMNKGASVNERSPSAVAPNGTDNEEVEETPIRAASGRASDANRRS